MNLTDFEQRITKILGDSADLAKENSIIDTDRGYLAFDKYRIVEEGGAVQVLRKEIFITSFTSKKTALSWCIFDKLNQVAKAKEIIDLDARRKMLQADLSIKQKLYKHYTDPVVQDSVAAKISQKQQMLFSVNSRLEKCVNIAKYWQIKGFNDEIARTKHSNSVKKY